MSRQQMRAAKRKETKNRTATYNLTKNQLNGAIKTAAKREIEEAYQRGLADGARRSFMLMMAIPVKILMDNYWRKTYKKRLPRFVDEVLSCFSRWQNEEITTEELKQILWEYGGVKLEE